MDVKNIEIDDFLKMTDLELDDLFMGGECPKISDLDGPYEGRVLSGASFPVNNLDIIGLVNLPWLPWKGKVFTVVDDEKGKGLNRLDIAGLYQFELFEFQSFIDASIFDDANCYVLDYNIDGEGNIPCIKRVRDEVRKVNDNLFLGRANAKINGLQQFVLYFALRPK